MNQYKYNPKFNFWSRQHLENFQEIARRIPAGFPRLFLEIGAFEGRTSVWLLDNMLQREDDRLLCVEPDVGLNLRHNLLYHRGKVTLVKKGSEKALPEFMEKGDKFDFIYIDGDHNAQAVLRDAVFSWELLKVGGILLFDDYEMEATDPWHYVSHKEFQDHPRVNFTHPRIAIDAFLNIYRGQYEIVFHNVQVGITKLMHIKGKNTGTGLSKFSYVDKR